MGSDSDDVSGKKQPSTEKRRIFRRASSATRTMFSDIGYRLGRDPDFISRELKELKARERAQIRTARTHVLSWLLLLLMFALLVVGVLILMTMPESWSRSATSIDKRIGLIDNSITQIESRNEAITTSLTNIDARITQLDRTIFEIDARHVNLGIRLESLLGQVELRLRGLPGMPVAGAMTIEQWNSGEFEPGEHECGLGKKGAAPPCVLRNASPVGANAKLVDKLLDPSLGPAIVLLVGGHDAAPLRGKLRRKFESNIQLAQMRADSVRAEIERAIGSKSPQPLWFFSVPRGASRLGWPTASDRIVSVSIIRMGKS